jgi:ribokinase
VSGPSPLAVVGHVEWVEFVAVDRFPAPGEIAHGHARWEEPAGGGAVAAVQLARLAGGADLFTALGDDELAARTVARLAELGVMVHAAKREQPTRRAVTLLDPAGERTIVTLGERLAPSGEDALPWRTLSGADGVYFTAGDAGALGAARAARVLVATPRAGDVLRGGVPLDALVLSAKDGEERKEADRLSAGPPQARPPLVVLTEGDRGGHFHGREGAGGHWAAAPLPAIAPGVAADTYGCGDSFAAGLTWGLARGGHVDSALELAARCGAACRAGQGPYGLQLRAADL